MATYKIEEPLPFNPNLVAVISFEYYEAQAQSYTDPNWPEEIAINSVTIKGFNLYHQMTSAQVQEIETMCLEYVAAERKDIAETQAAEAYDAARGL